MDGCILFGLYYFIVPGVILAGNPIRGDPSNDLDTEIAGIEYMSRCGLAALYMCISCVKGTSSGRLPNDEAYLSLQALGKHLPPFSFP
jgi:hypothetical protein